MGKENEFNEVLQGSVEPSVLRDREIQSLEEELKGLETLVVKEPEQLKREKEIKSRLRMLIGEKEEKTEEKVETKSEETEKFNIKTANYDQLLSRREEIKLELEMALASAVKDMKKIDELKKELADIDKAIIALEALELVDEKEDKKTEKEEEAEIEEKQKDEKDLSETEKQEKAAKEAELKKAYYDAMVQFYAIREINANILKSTPDRLVNTDQKYLQEIRAEDAMYSARDAYLKLGKADPYTAEREKLNDQAKKCEKQNRELLLKKTKEYRNLEIELARLQKARNEKEEEISKAVQTGAAQEVIDGLQKDLKELDNRIKNTKQDLAAVKENLSKAMETLELRRGRRRELNLESREYSAQSAEEQANIRYVQNNEAKGRNDYAQAEKVATSSIKQEVERNEERYKQIKKELKILKEKEPDNFEKRLALLEQLDDASQQLKASREVQRDVERGIEPDTDEAIKKAEKDYRSKEERKEDFVKEADKLIEAAKEQEKAKAEKTVEDPMGVKEEAEKKEKEAVTMAVVGAMAIGGPDDSIAKDAVEAATIHTVIAPDRVPPDGVPCTIAGLEEQVETINTPREAEKYEKTIEAIEEAHKVEEKAERTSQEVN